MVRKLFLVELTVSDLETSVAWLVEVLELHVILRDEAGGYALLDAGPARLALKRGSPNAGTVRLTFEVEDLAAELERLALRGILPKEGPRASPEGYRQAVLHDSDGYSLCLFQWVRQPGE